MNYTLPPVDFDLTSPTMDVLAELEADPDPDKAVLRYARAMATVHAAMKKHPDYELAFYCAAISGLGNKPHHEMFDVYSSVLTHRVLDAFGVGHGTVAWDLLHFAMENAASLAKSGRLDDDPHLASFLSEAAQIELLTLVEGTFTPEDFD